MFSSSVPVFLQVFTHLEVPFKLVITLSPEINRPLFFYPQIHLRVSHFVLLITAAFLTNILYNFYLLNWHFSLTKAYAPESSLVGFQQWQKHPKPWSGVTAPFFYTEGCSSLKSLCRQGQGSFGPLSVLVVMFYIVLDLVEGRYCGDKNVCYG